MYKNAEVNGFHIENVIPKMYIDLLNSFMFKYILAKTKFTFNSKLSSQFLLNQIY